MAVAPEMKILEDIIMTLDMQAGVRDIRQGLFHAAVLTRHCGLAAMLPRDALEQRQPLVSQPGYLLEKETPELVQMAYSESILEAAIGMATINSLLEVKDEKCVELNAGQLIAEKGKDKTVAIVGHFPFVPQLLEVVEKLWIVEKNPKEGDHTEDEAEGLIP
jgi:uncharacterized protein (DUF4213/DUF364 family)